MDFWFFISWCIAFIMTLCYGVQQWVLYTNNGCLL